MIELVPITRYARRVEILYDMLKERRPEQSISHREMPTIEQHAKFVHDMPYQAWYFILYMDEIIGNIYLTRNREIGIHLFERYQGKGFGPKAVRKLMSMWPGEFLANINPKNEASRQMFEKLGFYHIQDTLRRDSDEKDKRDNFDGCTFTDSGTGVSFGEG